MTPTYYEILQVAEHADPAIITAAYRAQMLRCGKHPDVGGDTDEAALINAAYETLRDPRKREAYDAALATRKSAVVRTGGEERRRAPRLESEAAVAFCIDHDTRWHPARVVDYSVLGVRLQTHATVVQGQHVVIVPPNVGRARAPLRAYAQAPARCHP